MGTPSLGVWAKTRDFLFGNRHNFSSHPPTFLPPAKRDIMNGAASMTSAMCVCMECGYICDAFSENQNGGPCLSAAFVACQGKMFVAEARCTVCRNLSGNGWTLCECLLPAAVVPCVRQCLECQRLDYDTKGGCRCGRPLPDTIRCHHCACLSNFSARDCNLCGVPFCIPLLDVPWLVNLEGVPPIWCFEHGDFKMNPFSYIAEVFFLSFFLKKKYINTFFFFYTTVTEQGRHNRAGAQRMRDLGLL